MSNQLFSGQAGKRLKYLRQLLGMDLEAFALQVNMSPWHLKSLENLERPIIDQELEKICLQFPWATHFLVCGTDDQGLFQQMVYLQKRVKHRKSSVDESDDNYPSFTHPNRFTDSSSIDVNAPQAVYGLAKHKGKAVFSEKILEGLNQKTGDAVRPDELEKQALGAHEWGALDSFSENS